LGHKFHIQTGREFFSRVCRALRLEPSEAGQAYLYGVLCHYALDAACHPFVEDVSREGEISHIRLETEFDGFLLARDGKVTPQQRDLSKHIQLTPEECDLVSRFYPGAEPKHIRESLKPMRAIRKLLAISPGDPRTLITKTMGTASREFADMVLGPEPDARCVKYREPLQERYHLAAGRFPDMLMQLGAHLTYNAPLGEEFNPIFG